MGIESGCNTGLVLGLSLNSSSSSSVVENIMMKKPCLSFEPSLTLGLSGDQSLYRQDSISGGGSSFSNASIVVKREREVLSQDSDQRVISTNTSGGGGGGGDQEVEDDDDASVNGRKKLRLTKAQSALLEEAFKLHSTLNPKQKQELARELKLRPRQVEVWFQNRRARTKLKQTEVDCEYLKKCCETLTEENRRLHKELQELKALKVSQQPLYMQLPAATLTMCPSCERIVGDANPSSIPPKPRFFNPFTTNSSAAC